ncbi:hypothetical protein LTS15_004610 [Exophiala xenobiotica]|nr:hypothetical protein LTS15_004610 [Exophiala xenobiotica]
MHPLQELLLSKVSSLQAQLAELINRSHGQRESSISPPLPSQLPLLQVQHQEHSQDPNPLATEIPPLHTSATDDSGSLDLISRALIRSATDDYLTNCHNRPLSLFVEHRFRQHLETGQVPRYLLLVFLAAAMRFSGDDSQPYGSRADQVEQFRRESWASMIERWQNVNGETDIRPVQAVLLHCLLDVADGRNYRAWIKIALVARICQELRMMSEPGPDVDPMEHEERRRLFWSAYILDKFATCERTRPSSLADNDCQVHLPSDDAIFSLGLDQHQYPTLRETLRAMDNNGGRHSSTFGLLVLVFSALGRCTSYSLHEHDYQVGAAPWASTSDFTSINSTLLQLESNFEKDQLRTRIDPAGASAPHLLLSHAVFHLCQILLHHPLLLLRRIQSVFHQGPSSFLRQAFQSCRDHAQSLTMLLHDALAEKGPVSNPILAYCAFVAGTVHLFYLDVHVEPPGLDMGEAAARLLETTKNLLGQISPQWRSAASMLQSLEALCEERANSSPAQVFINSPLTSHVTGGIYDTPFVRRLIQTLDHGLSPFPFLSSSSSESSPSRLTHDQASNAEQFQGELDRSFSTTLDMNNVDLGMLGSLPSEGTYGRDAIAPPSPLPLLGHESVDDLPVADFINPDVSPLSYFLLQES